jgi:type II secretory pathway pseudopilin PulG
MRVESLESRVESQKSVLALRFDSRYATRVYRFFNVCIEIPKSLAPSPQSRRSAMTLVELLVVIIILTTIVAAAIPLMSPSNDDRRLREAARGLNTFITGAQSRAIALKRPVGVALKRLGFDTNKDGKRPEDNGVCVEAYYVEQQPAYCGFEPNCRASVALCTNNNLRQIGLALVRFVTRSTGGGKISGLPYGWDIDLNAIPLNMIRPHDVIEVNGTRFELVDSSDYSGDGKEQSVTMFVPPTDNPNGGVAGYYVVRPSGIAVALVRPINDSGQQISPKHDASGYSLGTDREAGAPTKPPAPYWTPPAPYKIYRQSTPMADEPYQLPEGTAIDLRASGVGYNSTTETGPSPDNYFYIPGVNDNTDGVLIMFAPEGRVSRVTYGKSPPTSEARFDKAVVDNVYLLVGRRENSAPIAVDTDPTLQSSSVNAATTDDERAKLRAPLNWLLGSSRWVVIGSQSGRIATIENTSVDLVDLFSTATSAPYKLNPSSEALRNAQILASREFTREMGQVGGR